jgi:hypothetical protein
MYYKIIDLQNGCYLNGTPANKADARKYLIEYHSIDCDILELGKMNLEELCNEYQWEIEKFKGKPQCY